MKGPRSMGSFEDAPVFLCVSITPVDPMSLQRNRNEPAINDGYILIITTLGKV